MVMVSQAAEEDRCCENRSTLGSSAQLSAGRLQQSKLRKFSYIGINKRCLQSE